MKISVEVLDDVIRLQVMSCGMEFIKKRFCV